METNISRKRKLDENTNLDSNSNKRDSRDCRTDKNENASISPDTLNSEALRGLETALISDISPIISKEEYVLKPFKSGSVKAVTLLAKVDTGEQVEYVNIVPKEGDQGTKLVTGLHRCIGNQESCIGINNVFVTVLVEQGQGTKNVEVGDILGYAQTFGTLLTKSLRQSVSKLNLEEDYMLYPDSSVVVEAMVESLTPENERNYPIRFISTNESLQVVGERYTIQKGNSAKIRIRNVSEHIISLNDGYIIGTAESLISKASVEEIQRANDQSIEMVEEIDLSSHLSPGQDYEYVFLEIETIKASNEIKQEITQIGCCTSLTIDNEKKFFKVIEPKKLNHYLDNFVIAGDLLKFLHLQKNETGQFEFRKQFEIVDKGVEIPKCITEKDALQELASFLSGFGANCILVSIRKGTAELVMERMKDYQIDLNSVKGFCSWDTLLNKTLPSEDVAGSIQEFDDWYSSNVNTNVADTVHAETVASMLKQAVNRVNRIFQILPSDKSSTTILLQASSPIDSLFAHRSSSSSKLEAEGLDSETPSFLELSNSLRPMPTTITLKFLETIEILSDEEDTASVESVDLLNDEEVEEKVPEQVQVPEELKCPFCKDLISSAVLLPCCVDAACDECARNMLTNDDHICRLCQAGAAKGEDKVSPDNLIPNLRLRRKVFEFSNKTTGRATSSSCTQAEEVVTRPASRPSSALEPFEAQFDINNLDVIPTRSQDSQFESPPIILGSVEGGAIIELIDIFPTNDASSQTPIEDVVIEISDVEGDETTPQLDESAPPQNDLDFFQIEPTTSHQSGSAAPLQNNTVQFSTAPTAQTKTHCQVCLRNFNSLQAFQDHISNSKAHRESVKRRLNASHSPHGERVLWGDLKDRITVMSSKNKMLNNEMDALVQLALHFEAERATEIVEYIEERIFHLSVGVFKARLMRFFGLLCQESILFNDLIEKRIVKWTH